MLAARDDGVQAALHLLWQRAAREVGLRAILQRAADKVVQKGQVRVDVNVLARGVDGQGGLHERQVVAERLELRAVLREGDVGGVDPLGRHLQRLLRHLAQLRHELADGHYHPRAGGRVRELPLHRVGQPLEDLLQRDALAQVAVLAEHPADHLHEHVGQVGLVEHIEVGLRGELAERIVLVLVLARALGYEAHQVVRDVGAHQLATELEDRVHRADEPRVVGCVALGELRDLLGQPCAELHVSGPLKVVQQLVRDEDDVLRVGHPEEKLQRLPLEGLVRVLEAVDHDHLVLERVLLVDLHDGGERLDAEVLEVVVLRRDEAGDV